MKLLFNAANLRKGGAMHAAISALCEIAIDSLGHQWNFAVSDRIADELARLEIDLDELHVYASSPAKSLATRRSLSTLEQHIQPDCVFTFLGPAYVRFKAFHLLGCAQAWVTHSSWMAYRSLSFPWEWLNVKSSTMYQDLWYRRADAWVVQTETARQGLMRKFQVAGDRVAVVPNNCASIYHEQSQLPTYPGLDKRLRILAFSAMYKHKRLDLVPDIAYCLGERLPRLDFEFVLTLPRECNLLRGIQRRSENLGVADRVVNMGPIHTADGPALYQTCDVCLLPTVLETFSATYPESMTMGLPIVTTDLAFARDICRDAAIYFQPNDASDAAQKIAQLVDDRTVWERLTKAGKRIVDELPRPDELLRQYVSVIEHHAADHAASNTRCPT